MQVPRMQVPRMQARSPFDKENKREEENERNEMYEGELNA
jgi:hypothetical protein